jgi:N-acetylmuramoyl-L-alanine amidase
MLIGATLLLAHTAAAAPSAKTLYTAALAREQPVRSALGSPDAPPGVLADVRSLASAYVSIVRRYPASPYCDNALWQAGRLLLDAFQRFGQAGDRDNGVKLLERLEASYPTSRFVRQVPGELARLEKPGSRAAEAGPARSAEARPPGIATIRNVSRSVLADAVRITIEIDGEVPFHQERIPNPERVFLDLPSTRADRSLVDRTIRFDVDADVVRQVRIGRHPNNVTRVVLDASGVSSYSVYPLYEPYRLVVDCLREPVAAGPRAGSVPAQGPAPLPPPGSAGSRLSGQPVSLLGRRTVPFWQRGVPAVTPQHGLLLGEAHDSAAVVTGSHALSMPPALTPALAPSLPPVTRASSSPATLAAAPLPAEQVPAAPALTPMAQMPPATSLSPPASASRPVAPPARNSTGEFSIARQLGLGVSRIVIDPGHGGHDPGAKGKGVQEAELVLDVALRLEKLLQKVPGLDVILTRRSDEFVTLQERTAIANREGADLFLSIHANASPGATARGVETYFLNFANNLSAAAVAARENAASGQAMAALPDFVKAIALNNKLTESRDFATEVQRAMIERLRLSNREIKDLGVKQAPFVVLIGASMPSVLAEISFVTNPVEGRLLRSGAYRQHIAEALLAAIRKYQSSLQHMQTVAPDQPTTR